MVEAGQRARHGNHHRRLHRCSAIGVFACAAGLSLLVLGLVAGAGLNRWLGSAITLLIYGGLWWWQRRAWLPLARLRQTARRYADATLDHTPEADPLPPLRDPELADLAALIQQLGWRLRGYAARERDFTRDASHELRSPLTLIKLSVDSLSHDPFISPTGAPALARLRRAAHELELMVDALLLLARESDNGIDEQIFVVNELLQAELQQAGGPLQGEAQLELHEQACFALRAPPAAFIVLCWQLIRNAHRQCRGGLIILTVQADALLISTVLATAEHPVLYDQQHGFDIAIARRISERCGWRLELEHDLSLGPLARVRFPRVEPLPT